MDVKTGVAYHIKDEYFELAKDPKLMSNKEDGRYRPNFFIFADKHNQDIYWAIPISSKAEKYTQLMNEKMRKYGSCETIVIGLYGRRQCAFLIQNMFPITKKYLHHEHLINNESVPITNSTIRLLTEYAYECLDMYKNGLKWVFFTDVNRLYKLMENDL